MHTWNWRSMTHFSHGYFVYKELQNVVLVECALYYYSHFLTGVCWSDSHRNRILETLYIRTTFRFSFKVLENDRKSEVSLAYLLESIFWGSLCLSERKKTTEVHSIYCIAYARCVFICVYLEIQYNGSLRHVLRSSVSHYIAYKVRTCASLHTVLSVLWSAFLKNNMPI